MNTDTARPELAAIRRKMFVGGQWVEARSGKTLPVYDPATGQEIARVPDAQAEDVDAAVRSARATFESSAWQDMLPAQRELLMLRLADLVEKNGEELARLERPNNGKLLMFSRMLGVGANAQWIRYMAGWATKIEGSTLDVSIPFPPGVKYTAMTRREAVGVVGAIVPWNFPLLMAMWKIAPALACGCTVVLKPAEITPLSALRIGELSLEAGLPPGVFNIVPGFGRSAGQALVDHPDVDKVTFTGSPAVGRQILAGAAGNLKRVTLELGGKSANVIFADADLDAAVKAAASGIFFNTGQVCSAGSRVLVQDAVYDEVVERLAARARGVRVGAPNDRATAMGPIVSQAQMQRVLDYVDIGVREGATLVTGGARVGNRGYFVSPTVFADVGHDMRISQEEIFGPVVSVVRFSDEADALRKANGTRYSLAAGVWSRDIGRVHRFAKAVKAGTVWINTYGYTDVRLPWGARATPASVASTATPRSRTSPSRKRCG